MTTDDTSPKNPAEKLKNKGGRPVSPLTKLRHAIGAKLDVKALKEAPAYLAKLDALAKAGDMAAIKFLLEWVWPSRRGTIPRFDLGSATTPAEVGRSMGRVIEAMAAGELTADEGNSMISAMAARIKAWEMPEVSEKMAELKVMAAEILKNRADDLALRRSPNSAVTHVGNASNRRLLSPLE